MFLQRIFIFMIRESSDVSSGRPWKHERLCEEKQTIESAFRIHWTHPNYRSLYSAFQLSNVGTRATQRGLLDSSEDTYATFRFLVLHIPNVARTTRSQELGEPTKLPACVLSMTTFSSRETSREKILDRVDKHTVWRIDRSLIVCTWWIWLSDGLDTRGITVNLDGSRMDSKRPRTDIQTKSASRAQTKTRCRSRVIMHRRLTALYANVNWFEEPQMRKH